jgi:hypothetical protein
MMFDSKMEENVSRLITTISSIDVDVNVDANFNATLAPDMVFNEGHKLSITVYRYGFVTSVGR